LSYADKTLSCRECGQAFVFTGGEHEFHAAKGFENEPSRCPDCRAARKAARGDSPGGYGRREREMFTATCSACGNEAVVPFRPRGDKPVYCSDCYSKVRSGSAHAGSYR
jgi:CxxC-x17-CxxC domain-containing protein